MKFAMVNGLFVSMKPYTQPDSHPSHNRKRPRPCFCRQIKDLNSFKDDIMIVQGLYGKNAP